MYFKPKLEPKLKKLRIQWADVLPVLKEQIDSVEKLQEAKTNSDQLLREVVKVSVQRLLQQMWNGEKRAEVNVDGSATITAADGISTTVNPVTNADGSTTATLPDGTTISVSADGNTVTMSNPDGTVTVSTTNDDGSSTMVVAHSDGSTVTTDVSPSGEVTTTNTGADGTSISVSPDGKTITSVAADGSTTTTQVNPDGRVTITAADGSTSTVAAVINADGSTIATLADGTTIGVSADGNTVTTTAPDGTTAVTTNDNGTVTTVVTHPDGSTSTGSSSGGGSGSGAASTPMITMAADDGSVVTLTPDGRGVTVLAADGSTSTGQEIVRMVTAAVTGETHMQANKSTVLEQTDDDQARSDTTQRAHEQSPAILELVGEIWCIRKLVGEILEHEFEEEPLLGCTLKLLSVLGITADDEVQRLLDLQIMIRSRLVLQLASMYFNPKLEPKLQEHELEWADVLPVLKTIDFSVKGLKAALDDPMALFEKMAKASEPLDAVGKKLASMHLKPKLEPKLQKHELEWTGVLPLLEKVGSVEKLQEAIADPEQFLPQVNMSGPAAKKQAVEDLQSKPEPTPREHKPGCPDLQPVLETIDSSVEKLKEALALLEKLANMDEPTVAIVLGQKLQELQEVVAKRAVRKKLVIMQLKSKLMPQLLERRLQWKDVLLELEQNYSVEELREIQRALAVGSKDPLERLFAGTHHKKKPADTRIEETNGEGEAPSPTCSDPSRPRSGCGVWSGTEHVFETIVGPLEFSLHDDQKQNSADIRSEERSGEGSTYALSRLNNWNRKDIGDVPPGPGRITLDPMKSEETSSPSGRKQLRI
jgi:hypothetical protein